MRAEMIKPALALVLAASLAACSSKPSTDVETDTTPAVAPQQQETQVQPVTREEVKPTQSVVDVNADNFHNHPSNYDGTTSTRVIYFSFDNSSVPAAAFETLRAHAQHLKANSNAKVRLEGHADERGTREYNVALGERRAQSVEKFLRVQGVAASQIELVSYGEEKRAALGSDDLSHAKNRRVELNYLSGRP